MIYLILIFTLLFFLLSWRRLDLAVMILIAALPSYLIRFNIFGLPSTLLEVMIWVVFLNWFIKNHRNILSCIKSKIQNQKSKMFLRRYPFDWEIALLVIIAFISAAVAGFSSEALGIWKAYFFEPALLFIVVVNLILNKGLENPPAPLYKGGCIYPPCKGGLRGFELIFWPLAVSAFIVSAFAIYQKFTGAFIANPAWAAEETRRVVSFFGYPNAVGLYLGPIVLVMIGWLFSVIARRPKADAAISFKQAQDNSSYLKEIASSFPRLKAGVIPRNDKIAAVFISITIILSLLSIYFALSKGALTGVAAGLIFFGLLAGKKIRWATLAVLIVGAIGIISYQPARNLLMRNLTLTNISGQIRQAGWSDTLRMLKDGRLFTGAGLANFQAAVAPYHTEGIFLKDYDDPDFQRKLVFNEAYRTAHWQPLEIYLYPHNIMLNFWSELGLAGLLLFVWIFIKYFGMGIFNFQFSIFKQFSIHKFLNIGLLSAMIAIIVHGLVDVPYFKNDLAIMFWLLIAMMGEIFPLSLQRRG